jgi:hypothetical protein
VEFQRLCDVLSKKGNKLCTNVKNKMDKYVDLNETCHVAISTSIAKLHIHALENNIVNDKLNLRCV